MTASTAPLNLLGLFGCIVLLSAAAICFGLIVLLRPVLQRYALAHPNFRSSHKTPTPQGGGIAVIGATIAVTAAASEILGNSSEQSLLLVMAAATFVAVVGAIDDIRPIDVLPRLFLQAIGATIVIAAVPHELRLLTSIPYWLERPLLVLAVIWFMNLVNFMDGIDWMTAAEVAPLTAALAGFGLADALPRDATLLAFALCGATIGFAYFNRPIAQLFLGDVGSLPVGLVLGWLLVMLGSAGHFAAALLLPLYYVADTGITLLRRLANGERITEAHRRHFYQRAVDSGVSVYQVVGLVFALNIALIALAVVTMLVPSHLVHAGALAVGCGLVGLLLYRFERAGTVSSA